MKDIIKNNKTISTAIIQIYGYDNGRSRKKFYEEVENQQIDITHLTKRPLKFERIIKDCPVCGTQFETKLNNSREKITCSYACSNTYFRSGQNNPNWKNDWERNERNAYRRICFTHHEKECVICGENKIVAAHHYDANHNNNAPENLIPLCPTHHQYVHSAYKVEVIDKINEYRNGFIEKINNADVV